MSNLMFVRPVILEELQQTRQNCALQNRYINDVVDVVINRDHNALLTMLNTQHNNINLG